ncbi:Protein FAR1-RELATED SEQUENCE [Forsythia ovata]|uniref:Protein FAR1-RELATED SEQUENCE n=1 Tax=Forsythia ovata TaxID=205694 RepID=A0ABD1W5Q4_9LAMI
MLDTSDEEYVDEKEVHNNLVYKDIIQAPEVGMHFVSLDNLFEYYKQYAKQEEFGIIKKSARSDGNLRFVCLSCSRARNSTSQKQNHLNPNPLTKTGCKAKINILYLEMGSARLIKYSGDFSAREDRRRKTVLDMVRWSCEGHPRGSAVRTLVVEAADEDDEVESAPSERSNEDSLQDSQSDDCSFCLDPSWLILPRHGFDSRFSFSIISRKLTTGVLFKIAKSDKS